MWITSGGKIWICQNVRGLVSMGIIPCPHIRTPTQYTLTPTFYHRFLCGDSVMTTFSPLTISGRPFFYYIHFPDKKGVSSVMGAETSLRVLEDHFYPFKEGTDMLFIPQRGDHNSPFVVKTSHLVGICGTTPDRV
jgi:hypothetical protein